jgi:hypothetical protein
MIVGDSRSSSAAMAASTTCSGLMEMLSAGRRCGSPPEASWKFVRVTPGSSPAT